MGKKTQFAFNSKRQATGTSDTIVVLRAASSWLHLEFVLIFLEGPDSTQGAWRGAHGDQAGYFLEHLCQDHTSPLHVLARISKTW